MDSDTLRKIQLTELYILDHVSKFCIEHDIKYFLIGGTLLGAVRHQGFIPWDDDIDIGMLRDDYEKFCKLFGTRQREFILQNCRTENMFHLNYTKIRLNETLYITRPSKRLNIKENGIWIDVFPFDNAKNNKGIFLYLRRSFLLFLLKLRRIKIGFENPQHKIKKSLLNIIIILLKPLPLKCIDSMYEQVSKLISNNSNYLTNFSGRYGLKKSTFKREAIGSLTKARFENDYYYVPSDYHTYLSDVYGSYLELPPLNKRKPHHEIVDIDLGKYKHIKLTKKGFRFDSN